MEYSTEIEYIYEESVLLSLRSEVTGIHRPSSARMEVRMVVQYPTSDPVDYSFEHFPYYSMPTIVGEPEVEWMLDVVIGEASLDLEVDPRIFVGHICHYCNAALASCPAVVASSGTLYVFVRITFLPAAMTDSAVIEAMMRRLPEEGGELLGRRPAAAAAIENLQIVIFGGGEEAEAATNCVICLEDFEPAAELAVMPCGHRFHRHCLTRWLGESYFCPLCRLPLQREDSLIRYD